MFRVILICMVSQALLPLPEQEAVPAHTFTDKNGQQVTAILLSISSDRRKIKIRRGDGQEFELVINVLSLDDQQFIKEQLETVPS